MLIGKKVKLRAVEQEDLPQLLAWRNNPDFRKFFREYRELSLCNQQRWFEKYVIEDDHTLMFAIVSADAEMRLLGCCGLCYINYIQRYADLSLYIGWNNAYIDKEGLAEEACRLLFAYGFGELGLHKIWTEIYDYDTPKYELYSKLGFCQDGLLRDNCFYNFEWHDSRVMSLLSNDFCAIP